MKQVIVAFLSVFTLLLNAQSVHKRDQSAIMSLLSLQVKCWNTGNIECYMEGYWESDSLKFITKSEITTGWNATLTRYNEHYPDKNSMGVLVFEEIDMLQMNLKTIIVMGKWTLQTTTQTNGGRFTLICRKISGKWKIIVDHTS